jgi:hypothetical protein
MRRSYVIPMRWIVIYEYEVPGGALNLKSTQTMVAMGIFPFKEKKEISMAEPGIFFFFKVAVYCSTSSLQFLN